MTDETSEHDQLLPEATIYEKIQLDTKKNAQLPQNEQEFDQTTKDFYYLIKNASPSALNIIRKLQGGIPSPSSLEGYRKQLLSERDVQKNYFGVSVPSEEILMRNFTSIRQKYNLPLDIPINLIFDAVHFVAQVTQRETPFGTMKFSGVMNKQEDDIDKLTPIRAMFALLVTFPHTNLRSQPLFYLMQSNGHANADVVELLARAKLAAGHRRFKVERTVSDADPFVVGKLVTPKFKATYEALCKADNVYGILKSHDKMILCRHHMLKRIFWSMHDSWLVFDIKEGQTTFEQIIDLKVIEECIPLSKEAIEGLGPSKLRDDIPTQCCNSQNAYKLINDGYFYEGLFFFLLTPLFIGLGDDGINSQKYIRGQLDASVFCLYFYQFLYQEYTTVKRGKNVGFSNGKFKVFQSVFSLEMLEQLITYTLAILQGVKDHSFTNIQSYTTQSCECQFGRLRRHSRSCNFVDTAVNVLSNFILIEDINERLGISVNIPARASEYIINLEGTYEVPDFFGSVLKEFAYRMVNFVTESIPKNSAITELSNELLDFIEDCGIQTFVPVQAYKLSTRVVATLSDKNCQKSTRLSRMIVKNNKFRSARNQKKE
ncbi:Hypothetical_protein [Hexamita inflata]|uniref:Hypothetical_protein n=1 Tax=Hexamita inflata TaxID=28002 RepID=A0AA86N7D6_9EUKA|nr:Hypothetical protein HINF_LOCUS1974 [Hexamita inflata]